MTWRKPGRSAPDLPAASAGERHWAGVGRGAGHPRIYADRLRLRQVIINIVNTAIKFTDVGQVTIRALRLEAFIEG
jgi:signal transduction histidine kinase